MKKNSLNSKPNIFALVGPTCTYKSFIGVELANKFPFEIISSDSRLIYKHMDIGTSKPSIAERKNIFHYMIDLIDPNENYSVGLYKNESEEIIKNIFKKNKTPLFVGGTGLYLNAVLSGFSIPKVERDEEFRKILSEMSQEKLYKTLNKKDPEAAEKINKNDKFRIIRALEVIEKTGKSFSSQKKKEDLPFNVHWIGVTYNDREKHTALFKKRAEQFLENGFIDEVNFLIKKYGELELFKNTIGYAEMLDYLKNKIKKNELVEKITVSTRQYAKRQRTWFKGNKNINWIFLDEINAEQAINKLNSDLESFF